MIRERNFIMYIKTIDIAHPPIKANDAENILDDELREIKLSKKYRVLKIIHGKGSADKPSVLKEVVRNWAYKNKSEMRAVIYGEDYNMFDSKTLEMRKVCGQINDSDLGAGNQGITLLWVK